LPMGHGAEAYMMAAVFQRLLRQEDGSVTATLLSRLAHRIGDNRVISGVHFPVDLIAGRLVGQAVADCFLAQCCGGSWSHWEFNVSKPIYPASQASADVALDELDGCKRRATFHQEGPSSEILAQMWKEAAAEWADAKFNR